MSLEIVLQKEVSEGNWKVFVPVSYRNHFNGRFLKTFVFQNGDYIFKLNRSSKTQQIETVHTEKL